MATKKITELTNVTSVKDTDLFIVETSEGTRSVSGSIVKEYAKCNSNLLDNWYFANPVNRNNKSSYIGMDYNIDRWKGYGANQVLTINENGISASGDSENGVIQYLHKTPKNSFKDKEMTLSILTSDNALIVYSFKTNNETTWYIQLENGIHMEFGLVETPYVAIVKKDSSVLSLKAVKFEFSSQQTLAHKDTNGNWVLNEIPNYAEQMTICKQYDAYTGNYIGVGKPAYNLLDNSDFRNPVNQRGQTSYANGYAIDRWNLLDAAGNGVSVTDNGITIHACDSLVVFKQNIPPKVRKRLIGKCVTFAAMSSNGEVIVKSAVVPEIGVQLDLSESYFSTGLGMDIYCFTGEETLSVRFLSGGLGADTTIVWAALYEGEYTADTLPSYIPKGYAAERAECRRYYRRYNVGDLSALGYTHSGYLYWTIQFDDEMQSEPLLIETSKVSYITSSDTSFHTTDEASEMYSTKKGRVALRVPCQVSDVETAFVTPEDVIGLSADL